MIFMFSQYDIILIMLTYFNQKLSIADDLLNEGK